MRDDSGDNEFDAELAAQLLGRDDEDSEWETEEGEAPSFAQLYAAAEAASKAGPVRPTPAGAGSKRAGQEQPVLSLLGINLLEHFDRGYLVGAGVVLGACATSALLLAIKARLR
jgi:hypothetical protein